MRIISVILAFVWALPQLSALELAASYPRSDAKELAVSGSIHLRFSDALDAATLDGLTLHLDGQDEPVEIRRSTDLTQASITLVPDEFLEPNTLYEIKGAKDVRSHSGESLTPFRLRFTTGDARFERDKRLQFEQETFYRTRSMTTVTLGPDRRLYSASAFGELVRWDLDPDAGKPINRTVIDQDLAKSRQYIDLEWDPEATSDRLVLWASYAERLVEEDDPRRYFTGTIARFEIEGDQLTRQDIVVAGLPHGRERQGGFETMPHQPNGLCFHAGKLYQTVGSTTSSGGPANWGVEEQPLSAAILEIDYRQIPEAIDVSPASGYDPHAAEAPVRVFATGVRNALEILAHSNGHLYTATNINDRAKPSDGVPDDPRIPGDQNQLIRDTSPDHESLFILQEGRHYGFPNPSRNQFVLNGGNPTSGKDPFEITDYPVGTQPEPNFAPELMYPIWQWGGTSPNGMIEYSPEQPHPLSGGLLCCFYSAGDIAVMTLGSDGLPTAVEKLRGPKGKLKLTGPLDITQDPVTGNLYIAAFGTQKKFGADGSMIMLRPILER